MPSEEKVLRRGARLTFFFGLFLQGMSTFSVDPLLSALEKSAAYCERIEASQFSFTCEETIQKLSYIPYKGWIFRGGQRTNYKKIDLSRAKVNRQTWKNLYRLDYANGEMQERRIVEEKNGSMAQEIRSLSDLGLPPYPNVTMGPVRMLSAANQARFAFRSLGHEEFAGQACLVIEAIPLTDQEERIGKAWIAEEDGTVLKIVWSPRTFLDYAAIMQKEKDLQNRLETNIVTELEMEFLNRHEDICFPSRITIAEKYSSLDHLEIIRSELTAEYRDYIFLSKKP